MTNRKINQPEIRYYNFIEAMALVMEAVENNLLQAPLLVREYTKHLAKSQGKYIRAKGLLICSMNQENLVHENAVHLAVSIEILHLATLVHDDIIDDSDVRRGEETLQKKFGKKRAVLCGDYLLSLSLKNSMSIKERDHYTEFNLPDYVSRLCLGELEQYANNGNLELSTYRYLKIIRGKTASLFEGAFIAGGIFSGEDKQAQSAYGKLGRYMGMIFQLTDDCIDFEASESQAQKPVGKDYEDGVITLPLIYALKQNRELGVKLGQGRLGKEEIINQVFRLGGITFTKNVSKGYYEKSLRMMEGLNVSKEKSTMLVDLLNKAYKGVTK